MAEARTGRVYGAGDISVDAVPSQPNIGSDPADARRAKLAGAGFGD